MTGNQRGCDHPKKPGEGQWPGEFHGLASHCVSARADQLRQQGILVAFTPSHDREAGE